MVVDIDLELRRRQDNELGLTLKNLIAGEDAVAGPAAACADIIDKPWMNGELRLHLVALCFQFSHEQDPKLEGAILALNMFGNMVAQARDAFMAMKADDMSDEEHMAAWLAASDLVFAACLSRCITVLVDAFCDKTKRQEAPRWVLRKKEAADGEVVPTM